MNITQNKLSCGTSIVANSRLPSDTVQYSSRDIPSSESIVFHRHCQATVLSAFGTAADSSGDGNGLTWTVLKNLDLDNIDNRIKSANLASASAIKPWLNYFKSNSGDESHITNDLKAILQLIDISLGGSSKYNIIFNDSYGSQIEGYEFDSTNSAKWTHAYTLGRDISFKVDGNTIKFNTMVSGHDSFPTINLNKTISFSVDGNTISFNTTKSTTADTLPSISLNREITLTVDSQTLKFNTTKTGQSGEKLSLTLPKKTLTIKKNGTTCGTVSNVYMSADVNVDVEHDYNRIPAVRNNDSYSNSGSLNMFVRPYKYYNIYKRGITTQQNRTLTIDLSNYASIGQDIVQFEYHLLKLGDNATNAGSEVDSKISNIYVTTTAVTTDASNNITSTLGNSAGWVIVPLTDLLTLKDKYVTVFVFRADIARKILTYSVAYRYPHTSGATW